MLDKMLLDFVKNNAGTGTVTVPPSVMEEYLSGCSQALTEMFSKYDSKFPTVSDLAKDELSMWCRRHYPDVKEEFPATLLLTFWQGKIIECLLVALLRLAGADVDGLQERIYLEVDGIPDKVRGRMDLITTVKGVRGIVDIKIAHNDSFNEKWKTHETLTNKDEYGYNSQAGAYEMGKGLPFLGWLVFNKNNSELRYVEAKDHGVIESACIDALLRLPAAYGERPTLPSDEPEFYRGEPTGNFRIPPRYARSPYATKLWPDAKVAKRGYQTILYTKLNKIAIPGVKLEK